MHFFWILLVAMAIVPSVLRSTNPLTDRWTIGTESDINPVVAHLGVKGVRREERGRVGVGEDYMKQKQTRMVQEKRGCENSAPRQRTPHFLIILYP